MGWPAWPTSAAGPATALIRTALTALHNMDHRGAAGAEP